MSEPLNFDRIERQLSDWDEEEPRCDWWTYQRDYEAMYKTLNACPDLVEALDGLCTAICPDGDVDALEEFFAQPYANAKTALAKANGEQS